MGWKTRPREFMGQIAPAASASSTAGDMARYMTLLLNGGTINGRTIFSPKTALAFARRCIVPRPRRPAGTPASWISPCPAAGAATVTAAATLYFHSNLVIVPDLGLGIFVSANTDSGANLPRHPALDDHRALLRRRPGRTGGQHPDLRPGPRLRGRLPDHPPSLWRAGGASRTASPAARWCGPRPTAASASSRAGSVRCSTARTVRACSRLSTAR
ncbi:hypothetical protein ACRAWD_03610 [Caulobacter segnis]